MPRFEELVPRRSLKRAAALTGAMATEYAIKNVSELSTILSRQVPEVLSREEADAVLASEVRVKEELFRTIRERGGANDKVSRRLGFTASFLHVPETILRQVNDLVRDARYFSTAGNLRWRHAEENGIRPLYVMRASLGSFKFVEGQASFQLLSQMSGNTVSGIIPDLTIPQSFVHTVVGDSGEFWTNAAHAAVVRQADEMPQAVAS